MAYLHDGSVYQPGQGRRLTEDLRSAFLPEAAIGREVAEILERYVRSDYAEGYDADVVVADLIVRQLITSHEVALGVLDAAKIK
jgi:ABC-type microcin C transport system permease subunit YejB